jgi:hypothetical protein
MEPSLVHFPEALLDELATACWGRRPAVWRRPARAPLVTAADALRVLHTLTVRLEERGDQRIQPRLFLNGKNRGFDLSRHAARPSDRSIAAYARRLKRNLGGGEFGFVLEDVPALDTALWFRLQSLIRRLSQRVGVPAGGAHSEIFFGDYSSSPFRLHKDSLETLTWVLHGRKRLLVWPYEVFAGVEGVPDGAARTQHTLEGLDWEPYRDQATVLEGGPGDVFFWPASAWHVAESVDGRPVLTLTLALAPGATHAPGAPFRLLEEALTELFDQGFSPEDPSAPPPDTAGATEALLGALSARAAALLVDPAVQAGLRDKGLSYLSAGGFVRWPDQDELPALEDDDRLDWTAPILHGEPDEGGFSCAVNGIVLSATPSYLPLIDRLNARGAWRVGELLDACSGAEGLPEREELREALQQLGAARAFSRGPRAP